MDRPALGFVGFGEAGYCFAQGLSGSARLFAYDIGSRTPLGVLIRERAAETATTLLESPEDLARECNTLLSVVTAGSAVEAARQNVSFLTPRHLYVDLNSVSPLTKQDIAKIIEASPARFVEASIMAPVAPQKHKTPILLNGVGANELTSRLAPLGMQLKTLKGQIGSAAAVKMCRSIVIKGLEALLFECVLGASRYDATESVFESLDESFPGLRFHTLADYMIGRVVVHGKRRAKEMEEVAETLRAVDVEPIMAEATARRQEWSAQLDLRSYFGPQGPAKYEEVLTLLQKLVDLKSE